MTERRESSLGDLALQMVFGFARIAKSSKMAGRQGSGGQSSRISSAPTDGLIGYPYNIIITLVGLLVVLFIAFRILSFLLRKLLLDRMCRKRHKLRDFGEWAVITGGTDGIGRAISGRLLQEGLKVMIISRSEERLAETKRDLSEKFGADQSAIKTLAIDFSADRSKIYETIGASIRGIDVGILVNNVGMSYPHAMYYSETDETLVNQLIDINVTSTFQMTRLVYQGMVERKRGAIICIGSGTSVVPSDPLYCGYAGVKAAIEAFCRSLQVESARFNILVQCHTPLLITSKLSKLRKSSWTVPTPEAFSKKAVECIKQGQISETSTTSISPYFAHSLILFLSNKMPLFLWTMIRMSQCVDIRERAMKKKQEGVKKDT